MKALQDRILTQAKVTGTTVDVDSFLSHQVDIPFLGQMAEEFAKRLDLTGVTKILTVEASGIPLATVCAVRYGLPLVFVKKVKSDYPDGPVYKSTIFSFTYQRPTTLVCDQEFLTADDKVLIIDDFLAGGQSMRGLVDIVRQSGAGVAGIGIAIDKQFEGGGIRLRSEGYQVEALATIEKIINGKITFA